MATNIECETCKTIFEVRPYREKTARFCSIGCRDQAAYNRRPTFICNECKQQKTAADFYRDNHKLRGHVARCKTCCQRQQHQTWMTSPRPRFQSARLNAKKRGYQWELTFEEYERWIADGPCFFCGQAHSWGIDRLNNEPRYDLSNVVTCCGECNRLKGNRTLEDFIGRIRVIAQNLIFMEAWPFRLEQEETQQAMVN